MILIFFKGLTTIKSLLKTMENLYKTAKFQTPLGHSVKHLLIIVSKPALR